MCIKQNLIWAAVTGAAKLFIAVNVSYKTWIQKILVYDKRKA